MYKYYIFSLIMVNDLKMIQSLKGKLFENCLESIVDSATLGTSQRVLISAVDSSHPLGQSECFD